MDRANGVSFSYPAGWVLNGDDDAATAKLRVALSSQANAVVTLEGSFADRGPYRGTDFEAGAFAYAVDSSANEAVCFATLDAATDTEQRPVPLLWNGMRARRLDARFTVAGTDDTHHILAAFRHGQCYRFEVVVVSKSPDSVEKPMGPTRWRALRAEFDGVFASVRVAVGP